MPHTDVYPTLTRFRELEAALRHTRELAESERRARIRAEESAARAWRLVSWRQPSNITRRDDN